MGSVDNKIIISVIIPAYNRENTILGCINSVLAQTYTNFEIIVIDDCSTDATVEVVQSISDERVKCYKLDTNCGACYARNYGVKKAIGRYIAFQDSDDTWLPEKLEKQIAFMESKDTDFVFCGMTRINEFDGTTFYYPPYEFNANKNATKQILYENCISTQTILLKKELMDDLIFDPAIKRFQDWDFAIRISKLAHITYLPEALVISSIQENSITKTASRMNALKVIYEKHYQDIIRDKTIHARFMYKFGEEAWKNNGKKAAEYYMQSLKLEINPKIVIKYFLSRFKVKS